MSVEILKLIDNEEIIVLVDLFEIVQKNGIVTGEWLKFAFIMLPKKKTRKECSIIELSVSCCMHKIYLKMIHNRAYKKLKGNRGALFELNVLLQTGLDMN